MTRSKDSAVPSIFSSEWTDWSWDGGCSTTCGGGIRVRARKCRDKRRSREVDASLCGGDASEDIACNEDECPGECWTSMKRDGMIKLNDSTVWSPWSVGTCSQTCGGGEWTKERDCFLEGNMVSDSVCEGEARVQEACNTEVCPSE